MKIRPKVVSGAARWHNRMQQYISVLTCSRSVRHLRRLNRLQTNIYDEALHAVLYIDKIRGCKLLLDDTGTKLHPYTMPYLYTPISLTPVIKMFRKRHRAFTSFLKSFSHIFGVIKDHIFMTKKITFLCLNFQCQKYQDHCL